MIEYNIQYTEQYYKDALMKISKTQRGRALFLSLKGACGLLLAFGLVASLYHFIWQTSVFFGVLLVVLIATKFLEQSFNLNKLKKSPDYLKYFVCQLSEDMVKFVTHDSTSIIEWSAFTSAYQYADGMLLNHRLGQSYWLPSCDIVVGDMSSAVLLIQEKIAHLIVR